MSSDLEALYALAENLEQSSALLLKGNTDLRVAVDKAASVIGEAGTATQATLKAELAALAASIAKYNGTAVVALRDLSATRDTLVETLTRTIEATIGSSVTSLGVAVTKATRDFNAMTAEIDARRRTDYVHLGVWALIIGGTLALVFALATGIRDIFNTQVAVEKPYFCMAPEFTKCYSQAPHALTYFNGEPPPDVSPTPPPTPPKHRHKRF